MSRDVRVWHIRLDPGPDAPGRCLDTLDETERERLARLASPGLRRRFAVAHAATRQILAGLLDTDPAALRYRFGPWGKPELLDHPSVHHNLTHSGELALLAVSTDRPVGIDVERLRPALPARALAGRSFLPTEARAVAGRPLAEQPWWYQRFWTRKEACGKASGVPLVAALRFRVDTGSARFRVDTGSARFRVDTGSAVARPAGERHDARGCRVTDLPTEPGYLAAVAMLGAAPYEIHLQR